MKRLSYGALALSAVLVISGCSNDAEDTPVSEIGQVIETTPDDYREALRDIGADDEYIPGPGLEHVRHAVVVSQVESGGEVDMVVFGSSSCPPAPILKEVNYNNKDQVEQLVFQASVYNTACTDDWGSHFYEVEFFEDEELAEDVSFTYYNPLQPEAESDIVKVEASAE